MSLQEIWSEVKDASKPVTRLIRTGDGYKMMGMAFLKGMELKEHHSTKPAKLIVLQGSVDYVEGADVRNLKALDEIEIPVNVKHSVVCTKDAVCLLIQG
jgi:quercetin dioxygenase-like cupin family protein